MSRRGRLCYIVPIAQGPAVNYLLLQALAQLQSDPDGAADRLEKLAAKLLEVAKQLRSRKTLSDFQTPGGMGERVRIDVVGPDGQVKQQVDTRPE